MTATDAQVRIAMRERQRGRTQEQAAAKANLRSRKTVAKYERLGKLPSELKKPREYRTWPDAFAEDWNLVEEVLEAAPTLEAKALFEWLLEERPGKYKPGQVRTFQRRVRVWRRLHCERELSLPQTRRPGELMQVDGTWMNELGVTIAGEPFPHIFIHTVLAYSNWRWGRVALSESLVAVMLGIGSAVDLLGHVPKAVQTDPSSAATHALGPDKDGAGGRGFNEDYAQFLEELGIEPRSTHVASPNENGDVEAANGVLKRCIEQHLLLRGSRDFPSIAAYEEFLFEIMRRRNGLVRDRFEEELEAMAPLRVPVPPAVREVRVRVSKAGTARVLKRAYSLPSGLQGEHVTARVTEWQIEFWYANHCVRTAPREPGATDPCIDYRHVISSLLRKPGGFRNYRYFEALFPSQVFKRTWEAMQAWMSQRRADLAYLRVLKLAADTLEADVAAALDLLLQAGEPFDDESVKALVKPPRGAVPVVERGPVDLGAYDQLLAGAA